jgi:hypothetical protein
MGNKPANQHQHVTTQKPPIHKPRGRQTKAAFNAEMDKALAQAAYDRANAWALSPAGTAYGSTTIGKADRG